MMLLLSFQIVESFIYVISPYFLKIQAFLLYHMSSLYINI